MSAAAIPVNLSAEPVRNAVTLDSVLPVAAARFGQDRALFFEGEWSSFAVLDHDSNRFANGLGQLGIVPGTRIVIHVPNSRDWVIAYYGASKVGAIVVPVDAMLTPDELVFVLSDSAASVLITGLEEPDAIGRVMAAVSLSLVVLSFGAGSVGGAVRQADVVDRGRLNLATVAVDPGQLSTISYTSGTTGRPKGAMLSHRTVLLSASLTAQAHQRTCKDTFLSALPCTHVYGNAILHASFMVGGRFVLLRRFDAETALTAIATHKVTVFEGVPAMYARILSHSRLHAHDLSSLSRCTVGGQSIPVETIKAAERVLGCPLIELWGMTELGGPAITHQPGASSPPGSIGRPLPGMEVRLADQSFGGTDGSADIGELCLRGPPVMQGYLNRPDATAAMIDGEGWLHTGDLATLDDQGNVFIAGRSKEMIITAGYNIYPSEVEAAIAAHPAVEMVAVGKESDPEKGEIAVAYVVTKSGKRGFARRDRAGSPRPARAVQSPTQSGVRRRPSKRELR